MSSIEKVRYRAKDAITGAVIGVYTIQEWRDVMLEQTKDKCMQKIHNELKHKPRSSVLGYIARKFSLEFERVIPKEPEIVLDDKLLKQLTTRDAYKLSKCWDCQNACGGCSWSEHLVPVDNWEAKQVSQATTETTWFVVNCPLFKQDFFQIIVVKTDDLMRKIYRNKPIITYKDYADFFGKFGYDFKVIDDEDVNGEYKLRYFIRRKQ